MATESTDFAKNRRRRSIHLMNTIERWSGDIWTRIYDQFAKPSVSSNDITLVDGTTIHM